MTHWRPHHRLHYHHPQRAFDRWVTDTITKAPRMPYPLPGEIEGGWDIYRILEEIERLKPSIEAARREWFERRRAEVPEELKAWLVAKVKAGNAPAPRPFRNGDRPTLTPAEKRARKLQQTRESNARKRAERKAAGLPYK